MQSGGRGGVAVGDDLSDFAGSRHLQGFPQRAFAAESKVASGVKFTLTGGAQARNIFWQVAGYANLGTTSHFEGNILSMTAIHLLTGASLNGRALAQTAVTLDQNVLVIPGSSKDN